ncbi:MAG: AMP nucleosidase [Bdellovibrionaceae bacterium]|nr:AMP nucleosidase [Pseudobdellovibrionaceae bacterium]|tara:strand:+ start:368 stop:1273 length:906 start_codon:yes stop_codon:yes gene_type:complete
MSKKKTVKPGTTKKNQKKSKITTQLPESNPFFHPPKNFKGRIHTSAEKAAIARDMLERYTGTPPEGFQKQIILTNFDYYIQRFNEICGDEMTRGSAMTTVHSKKRGVSIINFSIGSPTAALIIELLATVEPKAVLLLGMTGGLHRSLKVGDFIVPTAAIRDEGTSRHFMPVQVPALPTFKVQKFVSQIIVEMGMDYRTGVVHTTDYRFWEFDEEFKNNLRQERALAIDMECSTLFIGGFVSKVPIGSLLLVSDLPLKRGGIKTKKSGSSVFRNFTDLHLEIGIKSMSEIAVRGEHIRHYKW